MTLNSPWKRIYKRVVPRVRVSFPFGCCRHFYVCGHHRKEAQATGALESNTVRRGGGKNLSNDDFGITDHQAEKSALHQQLVNQRQKSRGHNEGPL